MSIIRKMCGNIDIRKNFLASYRQLVWKLPKRYILVLLGHLGFFVAYALRVNVSVALVAMVNSTHTNKWQKHDQKYGGGSMNFSREENRLSDDFNWSEKQQGLILSSFFYGYLLTQLPGGWLGNRFGGKWVYFGGILLSSILSLLTPIAAKTNMYLFVAIRIMQGLGEGVTFPAIHVMMSKWAPRNERSRMVIFTYSGLTTGTVVTLPLCGLLSQSNFLGEWPSAFYTFGGCAGKINGIFGVVWSVLWAKFIFESPNFHPTITDNEKKYLNESIANSATGKKVTGVPWKKIFTSVRVWAIIIAHFSHNWIWYLVLTGLPSYFDYVLNFNLKENGFLSSLPFIMAFTIDITSWIVADYLIKNWLSVSATRRLLGMVGFYLSALFLVLASFTSRDQIVLSVTYMVLATGFLCCNNSSYNVNHLDIGPRFGGVLMGLTNTAGSVSGCITPLVTGYVTNENPTRENYRKVFIIAAFVAVIGGTFFNIFLSGEIQPWNNDGIDMSITEGTCNECYEGERHRPDGENKPSQDTTLDTNI